MVVAAVVAVVGGVEGEAAAAVVEPRPTTHVILHFLHSYEHGADALASACAAVGTDVRPHCWISRAGFCGGIRCFVACVGYA